MSAMVRESVVRPRPGRVILIAALLGAAAALPAQELVLLKDGTRAVGTLEPKARPVRLVTTFGILALTEGQVVERRPADELALSYEQQAGDLGGRSLAAREALVRFCAEQGHLPGLRHELEGLLAVDPDSAVAREVVKDLAARYELARGETSARPRERREATQLLFGTLALRNLVNAALVVAKAPRLPAEDVLRESLDAFKNPDARVRWMAAQTLRPFRDRPVRIVPLYRRSIADPDAFVRREAVRSLKVTDDPVFVRLFAKNLDSEKQAIRMNAAEALAEFGRKEALGPLIAALAAGRPTRNHVTVRTARAYVKDFDVEIAQAAVIADPIVDVVQEGTVLDVGVVGISVERGHLGRAIARLAGGGADFGDDAARWEAWLAANGR